ncbi:hypothetical protein, partial [Xanthomonas citri]|uniref:hypothetical protein n=1 Tax=Xanthomonas citri TaxID=346 RepID=UPI001F2DA143
MRCKLLCTDFRDFWLRKLPVRRRQLFHVRHFQKIEPYLLYLAFHQSAALLLQCIDLIRPGFPRHLKAMENG